MTTKIQIGNQPYIYRPTGLPIEGRLTVFELNTDHKATTYTLEGTEFVQATNPVLLHSGLPDNSLFADIGLYTIQIERYTGPEGQMSVDTPDVYFEKVDQYEAGISASAEPAGATTVDTLADLADTDVSAGVVTVLWHSEEGDCFPRRYIWDAQAQDAIDGGYVVGSNESDTGRWILLFGGDALPVTAYGVTPGNESNLNAALSFPDTVGSFHLKTASSVYFPAGTYSTALAIVTDKEMVFDHAAKFTAATFVCPRATVQGTQTSYIANFQFTASDAEAHSSWFRTLAAFWACGAKNLWLDTTNFFTSNALTTAVNLSGKAVHGTSRIDCAYGSGTHFIVAADTVIDGRIFNPTYDYVRVQDDIHGDSIFAASGTWDPGLLSAGHRVQYDYAPALPTFRSADRWLAVMLERRLRVASQVWGDFTLDLQGRTVSSITLEVGSFNEIRNAVVTGNLVVKGAVTLHGVKANVQANGASVAIAAFDSELTFKAGTGLASVSLTDCHTSVVGQWNPADISIMVVGGSFSGTIALGDLNANTYTASNPVVFRNVQLDGALQWRVHYASLSGCTGDVKIDCLPYLDGSYYTWNLELLGNRFVGSSRIWFTVYTTSEYQHPEIDGKCRMGICRIIGNRFDGTDRYGIKRIHWNPATLNCLIAEGSTWEYRDNGGNCPRLSPGFISNEGKWPTTQGDNPKWRVYDGAFNIWAPYLHYSDGGIEPAHEPTGLNPYVGSAVFALYFTNNLADDISHYIYGYRVLNSLADIAANPTDENTNNSFIVKLAMGMYLPSVPQFSTGTTYFPPLGVV